MIVLTRRRKEIEIKGDFIDKREEVRASISNDKRVQGNMFLGDKNTKVGNLMLDVAKKEFKQGIGFIYVDNEFNKDSLEELKKLNKNNGQEVYGIHPHSKTKYKLMMSEEILVEMILNSLFIEIQGGLMNYVERVLLSIVDILKEIEEEITISKLYLYLTNYSELKRLCNSIEPEKLMSKSDLNNYLENFIEIQEKLELFLYNFKELVESLTFSVSNQKGVSLKEVYEKNNGLYIVAGKSQNSFSQFILSQELFELKLELNINSNYFGLYFNEFIPNSKAFFIPDARTIFNEFLKASRKHGLIVNYHLKDLSELISSSKKYKLQTMLNNTRNLFLFKIDDKRTLSKISSNRLINDKDFLFDNINEMSDNEFYLGISEILMNSFKY